MDSSIKSRVIAGITLGAIVFLSTFNYWISGFTTSLFIALGLYEFFTMLEARGIYPFKIFGMLVGLLIPVSIIFKVPLNIEYQFLFVILALILLFLLQFLRRSHNQATVGISTTIFGIFYISWCLSFLIRIRALPDGLFLFLGVLVITKSADSLAYIVGSLWGRSPLIRRISPKKTWEGALGGFLGSIVVAMACRSFMGLGFLESMFSGMLIGILGQLGDLCESLIKRDCGLKDSGKFLPGLGGVLDILDSIIFVSPAFYLFLKIIYHKI